MSTTCVLVVWRNDKKCKYMFMFSLNNLARKGLLMLLVPVSVFRFFFIAVNKSG